MTYNTSSIDNVTGIGSWFTNINSEAGGYPIIFFFVVLWFAIYNFASNRNLDPGESSLASNFVVLLISLLSYFASLTSLTVVVTMVVLTLVTVVYQMFR